MLIADTVQVADDEFLLGTQLPRSHTLWSDRQHRYHDPLITVEVGRQACIAVLQRYYDVRSDWQLVSKRLDFTVVNLGAFTDKEDAPPEGILRLLVSSKRHRRGMLHEVSMEFELTIDDVLGGVVSAEAVIMAPQSYRRLRAQQRRRNTIDGTRPPIVVQPIDSARIGRTFRRHIAIGEQATAGSSGHRRYSVIVDQRNPSFFDHPQDHIPGALIVEIYRQAAIATATHDGGELPGAAVLTGCMAELSDFAELEAPAECSATIAEASENGRVEIAAGLHQFGKQIGEGRVELRFVPVAEQR